jgi:hypothetical protein
MSRNSFRLTVSTLETQRKETPVTTRIGIRLRLVGSCGSFERIAKQEER